MDLGITFTTTMRVTDKDTAKAMGSGDLDVLSTPRMIALMENAAMKCVAHELNEGETTVGTLMDTKHLRPSCVGVEIKAVATLVEVDNRRLVFKVKAFDGEILIGDGLHERFIVNSQKFMDKLK